MKRIFKVDVPCAYPDKVKCGKLENKWLCQYRIETIGLKEAKKEILISLEIAFDEQHNNPNDKPKGINITIHNGKFF